MYVELKEGKKYPGKDADQSDSAEHFQDAGYVLTENDLIVDIDVLSKDIIKKMLTTFEIETETVWTDRGAHLYFEKPNAFIGAKKTCALGFDVEYKHVKNTKCTVVKRNGVIRERENEGVRQKLHPIFGNTKKFESLLGMDDGEGRNNALYKLKEKIKTWVNYKDVLQFVNGYILATPLPEDELESLCRYVKFDDKDTEEQDVASEIIRTKRVVKYARGLWFNSDGGYINDLDRLKRAVIEIAGRRKSHYIDEVIKQIDMLCPLIDEDKEFHIRFNNGILRDGRFIEIESDEFTPYVIDVDYKANAEAVKLVDDYIGQLTENDVEYKNVLCEVLGHVLITNKELKRMIAKFFIFRGDGGNGKGTLLEIIGKIVNDKNVSRISLKEMTDERYVATLVGKLANLADDINSCPINDDMMKQLKNITTCDGIVIRRLYEQPINVKLTTSVICTSNHLIKSFEKGESYRRRVMWLPMFSKPIKKDQRFITKLTTKEALEYWVRLMVEGYLRLYENGRFSKCDVVEEYNAEYHEENDPTSIFLGDYTREDLLNERSQQLYEDFKLWKSENGYPPEGGQRALYTKIDEMFGLVSMGVRINKKTQRCFVPKDDLKTRVQRRREREKRMMTT